MRVLAITTLLALASATCPNGCSHNGVCGANDKCSCFQNWQGADCSQRTCPYSLAWVDTADGTNSAHYYAECSNKGVCDRKTAECKCFDGYEGKACRRSTCPEKCSGHGTCEYIDELAVDYYDRRNGPGAKHKDLAGSAQGSTVSTRQAVPTVVADTVNTKFYSGFLYDLWDAGKIQGCKCDLGYQGSDCSSRVVPKGDDPLTTVKSSHMKQVIHLKGGITSTTPVTTAVATDTGVLTFGSAHGLSVGDQVVLTGTVATGGSTTTGYFAKTVGSATTVILSDVSATGTAFTGFTADSTTTTISKVATTGEFILVYHDPYGGVWRTDAIDFVDQASTGSAYASSNCASNIQAALRALPNEVLQGVSVANTAHAGVDVCSRTNDGAQHIAGADANGQFGHGTENTCTVAGTQFAGAARWPSCTATVTFGDLPGQTGVQYLLEIDTNTRGAGSFPVSAGMTTYSTTGVSVAEVYTGAGGGSASATQISSYVGGISELSDCSDRGLDDGDGACECFEGFRGLACEEQEALV